MPIKKTFRVGKDIYDIEEKEVPSFLKDMPSAVELRSYQVGNDIYDIEPKEEAAFLQDFPNAKPYNAEIRGMWRQTFVPPQAPKAEAPKPVTPKSPKTVTDVKKELGVEVKGMGLPKGVKESELPAAKEEKVVPKKTSVPKVPKEKTDPVGRVRLYDYAKGGVENRIRSLQAQLNEAIYNGDEALAAEISNQINADVDKVAYFDEAIKGQKQLAGIVEPRTGANMFNIGMYQALGDFAQTGKTIERVIATVAAEAYGLDPSAVETYLENVYPKTSPLSSKIAEVGRLASKAAEERGEVAALSDKYSGSAWEALKAGDPIAAGNNMYLSFAQSLPKSFSYLNPATATLSAIGGVGNEAQQTVEQGGDATLEVLAAASIKQGIEFVSERIFGAGKLTADLVGKLGKEGAEQVVRQSVEQLAKKSIGRKVAEGIGEESVSEGVNQLAANLTDKYVKGEKDKDIFEGVPDAVLVGMFGGLVQGGPATVISHYVDRQAIKEYDAKKAKAQKLAEQALEAESPVVAEALEAQAEKENKEADEIVAAQNEVAANADPLLVEELETLNDEIDEIEAVLEQGVEEPEVVEALTAQLEEKEKEAENTLKKVRKSAEEKISFLQSLKEEENATKERNIEQSNLGEYTGVTEQQQREQEDRLNQEEPIAQGKTTPSGGDSVIEGGEKQEEVKPKEDEKVKQEDGQPVLEGVQSLGDEGKGGKDRTKLRSAKKEKEVVVKDTQAGIEEAKPAEVIPEEVQPQLISTQINEGSTIELPPANKYQKDNRRMEFRDGEWQQRVGGEYTKVSKSVQEEAQKAFELSQGETKADVGQEARPSVQVVKRLLKKDFDLKDDALHGLSNDNNDAIGFLNQYPENFLGIEDIGPATKITGITSSGKGSISKVSEYSIQLNFKNDRTKVMHFKSEQAKNSAIDKIYEFTSKYRESNIPPTPEKVEGEKVVEPAPVEEKAGESPVFSEENKTSEQPELISTQINQDIVTKLESLKIDTKGKLNAFGIAPAAWNAIIDTLIGGIKAGRKISELINEAVANAKSQNPDFDEAGFMAKMDEEGIVDEEVQPEPEPTPEPPKPKKDEAKPELIGTQINRKVSKYFKTIQNNKSLQDLASNLSQEDFEYDVRTVEQDKATATQFLLDNGIEAVYEMFDKGTIENQGLRGSEIVQLSSLLLSSLIKSQSVANQANDLESAQVIRDMQARLTEATRPYLTEAGRTVNAAKSLTEDFSRPETLLPILDNAAAKAKERALKSTILKKGASNTAKNITTTVNSGKEKVSNEVAKMVDEELFGAITKGKKGLSKEQKQKIKGVFDQFKVNPNGTVKASILPIKEVLAALVTPELYNKFVDKVGDLVAEGASLSLAMTQVSTEFIKEKIATPKAMAAARKALSAQVNEAKGKPVKPKTEAQLAKEAAAAELKEATEEFNAQKEISGYIEKQRKKVKDLRAKENQRVLDSVQALELKRSQQLAKEAADLEDKLLKEKKELADALALERIRVQELREKEAKEQSDRIAKLELQRAQQAVKEAKKKVAETEKKIKSLVTEISYETNNKELAKQLVDEYLGIANDTNAKAKLVEKVKDKFGITDDIQAGKIADKIISGVKDNITDKLAKKYGETLTKEEKADKAAGRIPQENPLNELARAAALGVLTPEDIMDFFKNKYDIAGVGAVQAQKIIDLSLQYSDAPTPQRKAQIAAKIQDELANSSPRTFAELTEQLWYFKVLSPVLTGFLGTGDVNITANLRALKNNVVVMPLTATLKTITEGVENIAKKKTKKSVREAYDSFVSTIKDVSNGYFMAFAQSPVYDDASLKSAERFLSLLKNTKYFDKSITYLRSALSEGTAFAADYEQPFLKPNKSAFDIGDYIALFKRAENGDKKAVKHIATIVNALVNAVPRTLGGQDLMFQSVLGNAYLPQLLREKYKKEGLTDKEIDQKIFEDLFSTKEQVEVAKEKAKQNRIKFDLEVKMELSPSGVPVWKLYDRGKYVSVHASEATANEALDERATKGLNYKRDVIFYSQRYGEDTARAASRIAQEDILSGKVQGGTKYIYNQVMTVVAYFESMSNRISQFAKDLDTAYEWDSPTTLNGAKSMLIKLSAKLAQAAAVLARSFNRLFAFIRVGFNFVRDASNYTPLGLARFLKAYYGKHEEGLTKALSHKAVYDEKLTDVEKFRILAKSIFGSASILTASVLIQSLFKSLIDDDDEKTHEGEIAVQKLDEWFRKKTGGKALPEKVSSFYMNLKKGQAIGSLEWLSPNQRDFYRKTGLFPEYSVYEGVDENGQPKFTSVKNDPAYSFAMAASTYNLMNELGDDKDKVKSTFAFLTNPFTVWKDLSIGQGVGSFFKADMTFEKGYEKISQTMLLDNIELLQPNIIRTIYGYVDGKMRRQDNLFTSIENEGLGQGVQDWTLNRVFPAYLVTGKSGRVVKGMFGEDLYRVPAETQGMVSGFISDYIKSGKNQEEKRMYQWLDINGFRKVWTPSKEAFYLKEDGTPVKLTPKQRDEFGAEAGKLVFDILNGTTVIDDVEQVNNLSLLQDYATLFGERAFSDKINNLFNDAFAYVLSKNTNKSIDFGGYFDVKKQEFIESAKKRVDKALLSEDNYRSELKETDPQLFEEVEKISKSATPELDAIAFVSKSGGDAESLIEQLKMAGALSAQEAKNVMKAMGID